MFVEIILLVGFSIVITLLMNLVRADTPISQIWQLFLVTLGLLTVFCLVLYFILDWILPTF